MNDVRSIEKAKLFFISGLEKLNNNNLVGAEKDFELSLTSSPDSITTIIHLSSVLIKLKKLKKLSNSLISDWLYTQKIIYCYGN